MDHKVAALPAQHEAELRDIRMATRRSGNATVVELQAQPEALSRIGGSSSQSFNEVLLTATLGCMWIPKEEQGTPERRIAAGNAALAAFKAADEIEGMIAAQATALHFAAMECLRRAMLPDQHPDVANKLRRDGANLSRAVVDMVEALERRRGKAPQVVRVERVVVHEGGQAVVGNVQPVPKGG